MSDESKDASKRPYRKRRRAEHEAETRLRITEAAVKLHGSIGPAKTTVSGIAAEAGVQRATVYRHFPDEDSMFAACTAHYWAKHLPPDIEAWHEVRNPGKRLPRALAEFYAFYEETEGMLEKTNRDAGLVAAMAAPREAFLGLLAAARDTLMAGRRERGAARKRVEAAVGHALFFSTWQSLVRVQGLSTSEAVSVMAAMVESAGAARVRAR